MIKGVKLGADNLVFIGDAEGRKIYRMESQKTQIWGADIDIVMYGFYKDRLEDLQIHFRSSGNFTKLKEKLFQLCGPGRQPNPIVETYHWYGKGFSMLLTYNRTTEKGVLGYTYLPIYRERREDRKLEMVNSWLQLLTETERAVIALRFGFGGKDALTVESTGECLGLTLERVREIEAKAVGKLREVSQKKDKDLAA
jgi:hypothetical protein